MSLRIVVGIGELAVTAVRRAEIVTHALGSCVAVCVWDAKARLGGMLHFMLPDSAVNPERAQKQPGTFADTGIPLLLRAAFRLGADKSHLRVVLLGGAATVARGAGSLDIGAQNAAAARHFVSQHGLSIHAESLGGTTARTVTLSVDNGRLQVNCGRDLIEELQP
jgi:chemotaxis protein CheD